MVMFLRANVDMHQCQRIRDAINEHLPRRCGKILFGRVHFDVPNGLAIPKVLRMFRIYANHLSRRRIAVPLFGETIWEVIFW